MPVGRSEAVSGFAGNRDPQTHCRTPEAFDGLQQARSWCLFTDAGDRFPSLTCRNSASMEKARHHIKEQGRGVQVVEDFDELVAAVNLLSYVARWSVKGSRKVRRHIFNCLAVALPNSIVAEHGPVPCRCRTRNVQADGGRFGDRERRGRSVKYKLGDGVLPRVGLGC